MQNIARVELCVISSLMAAQLFPFVTITILTADNARLTVIASDYYFVFCQ